MNDAKHSACAPVRISESTDFLITHQDAALQAAHEGGPSFADVRQTAVPQPSPLDAPDLALEAATAEVGEHPERAADLARRLGIGLRSPLDLITPIVAGAMVRPPELSPEFEPAMRDGAVDSGLSKSAGQEDVAYGAPLARVRAELLGSMMFARHVGLLMEVVRSARPEDVRESLLDLAAHLFRAGFLAGVDACDAVVLQIAGGAQ